MWEMDLEELRKGEQERVELVSFCVFKFLFSYGATHICVDYWKSYCYLSLINCFQIPIRNESEGVMVVIVYYMMITQIDTEG